MSARMRFSLLFLLPLAGILASTTPAVTQTPSALAANAAVPKSSQGIDSYGKIPLSFEANQGQADPQVKFLSRGSGYSLFLTDSSAVLALGKPANCPTVSGAAASRPPCANAAQAHWDVVRMTLDGATKAALVQPAGVDELPGKVNYFLGSDPSKWRSNLPTFAKVRYTGVYDGIDLVYYGNQRQLEYDFVVAPGASPAAIRLNFAGQERLGLAANGDLTLQGRNGSATFHKPVIYQEKDGQRHTVPGSFQLAANHSVRFSIGSYDHTRPLVIDPILVYSTYLGGHGSPAYNAQDGGNGIAVDAQGNAYIVGTTYDTNFPLAGSPFQSTNRSAPNGRGTAFISKLNAAGSGLVYSTYLGGTGGESGYGIALDGSNNAYVTGTTYSRDFPVTAGAFQSTDPSAPNQPLWTGFVTKLNATGSALVYSTYLGGAGGDSAAAITLDSMGDAYVTGSTYSTNFPVTAGAYQATNKSLVSGTNAFVTELNPTGTGLVFSTYLGGAGKTIYQQYSPVGYGDYGNSIALDSGGNVYVAGTTYTIRFPSTLHAFQFANLGWDSNHSNVFVTKFNPTGTALIYSTLLGGRGGDVANAIDVDADGDAYVGGSTYSLDFPLTANAVQSGLHPADGYGGLGFLTKLNPTGRALVYSTYISAVGVYSYAGASVNGVKVDATGAAHVTGTIVYGAGLKTPDAVMQSGDVLLVKVSPSGSGFDYSDSFGGGYQDSGNAIALDASGAVYITGITHYSTFPTTSSAFQKTAGESPTGFVSKFDLSGETTEHFPTKATLTITPPFVPVGQPINLSVQLTQTAGQPVPTGSITFIDKAYPYGTLGTATLDSTGTATLAYTSSTPVADQAYGVYAGDSAHLSNLSNIVGFSVRGQPASVQWPDSYHYYNGIQYGQQISGICAMVVDTASNGLPGYQVSFSSPGLSASPSMMVTDANGDACIAVTGTMAGLETLTATVINIPTPVSGSHQLPVHPAPLTLFIPGESRPYGSPNPVFNYKLTGVLGSDSVIVTPQTTAIATSPVGLYPITATLSGANASDYTVTVIGNQMLAVHPAVLSLSANQEFSTYGQTPPPTGYTLQGFVNGETSSVVSGAPILSFTASSTSPAGHYPIAVQLGTLSAPNYKFAVLGHQGDLFIAKAPLTVKANNLTMPSGGPIPPLTWSFTGFVNGDIAVSAVTGTPGISTSATTHSDPGTYPIYVNIGTLKAANYFITASNGVMTIQP